jgi:hypothetical protein
VLTPATALIRYSGLGGVDRVATAGTDAEGTDSIGADTRVVAEEVDGAADVLDPHRGDLLEMR